MLFPGGGPGLREGDEVNLTLDFVCRAPELFTWSLAHSMSVYVCVLKMFLGRTDL